MRRLCSTFLLSVAGCTLWEVSTPCDSAPEVSVEQDPLWTSSRTTWQKPAVGNGFVCAADRSDGDSSFLAPAASLACFGPAADTVLPDSLGFDSIERLLGGGEMLCAMDADSTDPDVIDFGCWGTGAEAALEGLADVLGRDDSLPSNVEALAPADGYLCAKVTLRQGRNDPTNTQENERSTVLCTGEGSVVSASATIRDYLFDEIHTAADMACGRADQKYVTDADGAVQTQSLNPPAFVCWGDSAADLSLEDSDQSACWGTFAVSDGVLCTTGPPPDDPNCQDHPRVQCWGPEDHPIVAGLQASDAVLGAAAPPFRLSLGPDFGCAHYDPASQEANNALVCWGAEDSLAGLTPSGAAWQDLAVAPEAYHACALDQSEQDLDPNETEPPPPTGRLTCWGDDQDGALALD